MPKKPLTAQEASARHARKYNQRQRAQYPLYMEAGLEGQLIDCGLIRDRPADAALRSHQALKARLDEFELCCQMSAQRMSGALKRVNRAAWGRELLHLRRLRARFPSMRRFVNQADHWRTALRAALTPEAYLAYLDEHEPDFAAVLRRGTATKAKLEQARQRGAYNPWK